MKIRISIFFSLLFLSVLIAPTIICLTNSTQEIAFFIDINEEEEENKGKEESKTDSKLKLYSSTFLNSFLSNAIEMNENIRFHSKNYTSKHPKVTKRPPKYIL